MESNSLTGKLAVVTGGSSGIGAACVRQLAREGASVVIGYHRGEDRALALLASLPGSGHAVLPISLLAPYDHSALVNLLRRNAGKLDVLVNSAGFTKKIEHANLDALDENLFAEILSANVVGPYSVVRALLPMLKASGEATVVNVSSVSAFTGSGSNIAYCAAKAAIDTMTMSFARSLGDGVRYVCVSPASVDTGFVPGRDRQSLLDKAAKTPLGRVVTPEDVALAVLACVTHLRTTTGTHIIVDGGQRL